MTTPLELWSHALRQGPTVSAMGRLALRQALAGALPDALTRRPALALPGPALTEIVPPRDPELLRSYARWCRSDASSARGTSSSTSSSLTIVCGLSLAAIVANRPPSATGTLKT